MKIHSKLLKKLPTAGGPYIKINFGESVEQHYSIPSYNGFDLVVEVGSALGLWLGLSAASLCEMFLDSFARFFLSLKQNT